MCIRDRSSDELVYDELNNQINEVQDRAKNEEIALYNNNNYDYFAEERGEQGQGRTSYVDDYGYNEGEDHNEGDYDHEDDDVEEDEEEDEEEEDDDESDDEGLSFYAPSILSRSGSSTDILSTGMDTTTKKLREKRGR